MGWFDLEKAREMAERFERGGYGERHDRSEYDEGFEDGCKEGYRKAMEEMEYGGYGEREGYGERGGGYGGGYGERRGVKGTGRYSRSRR